MTKLTRIAAAAALLLCGATAQAAFDYKESFTYRVTFTAEPYPGPHLFDPYISRPGFEYPFNLPEWINTSTPNHPAGAVGDQWWQSNVPNHDTFSANDPLTLTAEYWVPKPSFPDERYTEDVTSLLLDHLDAKGDVFFSRVDAGVRMHVTEMAPIPEPETWALMLAGVGAVGGVARRARRQA